MSQQQLDSTSQQYFEINSHCYADLKRSLQEKQTKFAIMKCTQKVRHEC